MRHRRVTRALASAVAGRLRLVAMGGLLLAGCQDIEFAAVTAPPPGAEADLDDEEQTIRLSRGAALAFECSHPTEGNCGDATIRSASDIAAAALGYDDALTPDTWRPEGPEARTVFVVIGLATGTTEIDIETDHGDAAFDLEIVD